MQTTFHSDYKFNILQLRPVGYAAIQVLRSFFGHVSSIVGLHTSTGFLQQLLACLWSAVLYTNQNGGCFTLKLCKAACKQELVEYSLAMKKVKYKKYFVHGNVAFDV